MLRTVMVAVSCGLFATWTSLSTADELPLAEDQAQLLIRQLEDRDADKRDQAEEALRQAGPIVLDYLPEINDRTSGEMKVRLRRIRTHLNDVQTIELAKGSRLTLEGEMTLSEAITSIQQQTGNVIVDFRERLNQNADGSKLLLDIVDQPFWMAFDQLADVAGISVYPFVGEARKLAIVSATETTTERFGRAAYEGLFRIEATQLACQRNLRDTSQDMLRLTLELIWEPRVLPIVIRQDLAETKATTDTGEEVGVSQTGVRQIPVQPGVASIDLQMPLSLPDRSATELAMIKGQFVALVPGREVTFAFDDLVNGVGKPQSRGGLTVVLDDLRLNEGLQQVSIRIRFDQAAEAMQFAFRLDGKQRRSARRSGRGIQQKNQVTNVI